MSVDTKVHNSKLFAYFILYSYKSVHMMMNQWLRYHLLNCFMHGKWRDLTLKN